MCRNNFVTGSVAVLRKVNKNLAIANRSRVSCAHNSSRDLRDLEMYVKGHSRSLETEPFDRSYITYC